MSLDAVDRLHASSARRVMTPDDPGRPGYCLMLPVVVDPSIFVA
jgi:hypothetical protein